MIHFNKPYNNETFLEFLRDFLPTDFVEQEEDIIIKKDRYKEIINAKVLGKCESLGLEVLEMDHTRENDPRISIATDAFKILADHWVHRALVVFRNKESGNWRLSYLTIALDLNDKNKAVQRYSNPRRYSFYLGEHAKVKTPEQQLIKKGKVKDIADLLNRFSVEVVNKDFYLEVAKRFDLLVQELVLPSVSADDLNTKRSFAVRLIGRLVFCWFLKQKKSELGQLIPDELISSTAVGHNYYHSIIEPLFFEILNTSIEDRGIRNNLFDKVPYLNGGLFNPQSDDYYEPDRTTYASKHINTLKISDTWFIDFSELLETYNFTIDENTVFDQELSVDPEMLGRIFENLLAEINPETGISERKRTGSFYTPRQIVEYMVDQSLIAYLQTKTNIEEKKLSALLSYDLNDDLEYPLTDEEKLKIIQAIEQVKILDPACGSGAFPIGALQKIVYILQIIDPDCKLWMNEKLKGVPDLYKQRIINEFESNPFNYTRKLEVIKNSIFGVDIQHVAVEVSRLRCFLTLVVETKIDDTRKDRGVEALPNLDFKFVCANSLISAPEQTVVKKSSLFADDFHERLALAVDKYFSSTGESKRSANNEIHKLIDTKVDEKLKDVMSFSSVLQRGNKDMEALRAGKNKKEIDEHARILSLWSSYKNIFENKPVDFFETKYFFPSVKDGFDIVIGNPPYVQLQKMKGNPIQHAYKGEGYEVHDSNGDIYCLFYERGLNLSKQKTGLLCYITSNKWMRAGYGEKLRTFFSAKNTKILIDLGPGVFETATVDTNILLIENTANKNQLRALTLTKEEKDNIDKAMSEKGVDLPIMGSGAWFIGTKEEIALKKKIESVGKPLKEWDVKINYGIKTGLNEAFIIDTETKERLCREDPKSAEILKPILRGRDIQRYGYEWAGLWLIFVPWHFPLHKDPNISGNSKEAEKEFEKQYPVIFKHLVQFKEKLLDRNKEEVGKRYEWYALQRCAATYYPEFEKEKVVWQEMSQEATFSYDNQGVYCNDTGRILSGNNIKFFVGLFNSKLFDYTFSRFYAGGGLGEKGIRYKSEFMNDYPIPPITPQNQQIINGIELSVEDVLKIKKGEKKGNINTIEREIDELVCDLYGLTQEERDMVLIRVRPFFSYENLTSREKEELGKSFALEYSKIQENIYVFTMKEEQDYDFILSDSKKQVVKVQHTFAEGSDHDKINELKNKGNFDYAEILAKNPKKIRFSSMPTDQRVDQAILRKEKKYSDPTDIILLIQFDLFPDDIDFYKENIHQIVQKSKFKSIWIYSTYNLEFRYLK